PPIPDPPNYRRPARGRGVCRSRPSGFEGAAYVRSARVLLSLSGIRRGATRDWPTDHEPVRHTKHGLAPDHGEAKRLVKGDIDRQVCLQIGGSRELVDMPATMSHQ